MTQIDVEPIENESFLLNIRTNKTLRKLRLLSPLETQTNLLSIHSIKPEHIEGMIRIKYRSIAPCNSDSLRFDWYLTNKNNYTKKQKESIIPIFATTTENYSRIFLQKIPCIPPIGLALSLAQSRPLANALIAISCPSWTDLALFQDNAIRSVVSIKDTPPRINGDRIIKALSIIDSGIIDFLCVDLNNESLLSKSNVTTFRSYSVIPLTEIPIIANKRVKSQYQVFSDDKKKKQSFSSFIVILLATLNILLFSGFLEMRIHVSHTRQELLRNKFFSLQRESAKIETVKNEISKLSDSFHTRKKPRTTHALEVIYALTQNTNDLYISSLVIQESSYLLTGEHRDPIFILNQISSSPLLTNSMLVQAISINNTESFSISGEIMNDSK